MSTAPVLSRRRFLLAGAATFGCGGLGILTGSRRPPPGPGFDVCIVGSGFAGTFLALELVRAGARVLVLEAGPVLFERDPQEGAAGLLPWTVEGDAEFPIDNTRTIGLGGTSRRWNGFATRLLPADLRTRSEYGLFADWPISYADLEPWYCRAEAALDVHGSPVPSADEPPRACPYPRAFGGVHGPVEPFPARSLRFFRIPRAIPKEGQGNLRLADRILPGLARQPGASIRTGAPALRFVAGADRRIDHVEVLGPGGGIDRIRAGLFVAAAGPFENARLLLASALPGETLGGHFHAHPRLILPARLPPLPGMRGAYRSLAPAEPARRRGLGSFLLDLYPGRGVPELSATLELEPAATNRIRLLDGPRAGRIPTAALRMDLTATDRGTWAEAEALLQDLADPQAPAAGPKSLPPCWYHPAGTTRMAADPAAGTVDPDGLVFGTRNLFCTGSSVFPASGCGNPTLTVVALALRLAAHLRTRPSQV